MRRSRWEVWQGHDKKWYYHKRSPFNRISEPSQGYANKWNAKRAAHNDDPSLEIVVLAEPPY